MKEIDESPDLMTAYLSSDLLSVRQKTASLILFVDPRDLEPKVTGTDYG